MGSVQIKVLMTNCLCMFVLQEMFIAQLMKESHKTALECCHKEITYGHLGMYACQFNSC